MMKHELTLQEIAWAAGLIEGEGSFIAHQLSYKDSTYWGCRVAMSMNQRDIDVLKKLQFILGGRLSGPHISKKGKPGQSEMINWYITKQNEAYKVAQLLLPYLGQRRQGQARHMMECIKQNKRFVYETGIDTK